MKMHIHKIFPFRLITFDVTNTILNFTADIGKIYSETGEKYGVKCDPNELTQNFKRNYKVMNAKNPNFGQGTGISWQNWWNIVVNETFKNCHSDLSDSKLNSISKDLIAEYKKSRCWKPAPGALDLLNYLKDRGVRLGVISNFDPRLHDILSGINMNSYFKFVLTSYESGICKPNRKIFEKAMTESELKNLRNAECLHVGDTFELDYIGAKSAGWKSFLILRKKSIDLVDNKVLDKNHVFEDLRNLQDYMELQWNSYSVQ
ncbi:hypothetical protein HHI36_018049 [Cryptolaemus montrouzieri]|uniref:Rhythmically expressed gene 2 protein n=1 Tax=Cryptolaemus montrouzieri TaxID=559131 RepID=A0ABD2P040_9CUCU